MPKSNDNSIDKTDLDTIIEVNRKAIELHTEVAEQNEEVLEKLDKIEQNEEVIKRLDKIENMQLKIYILLATGVLGLIIQVIQLLVGKH